MLDGLHPVDVPAAAADDGEVPSLIALCSVFLVDSSPVDRRTI